MSHFTTCSSVRAGGAHREGGGDVYRNTSELGKLQVDADYVQTLLPETDAEKTQSILQDH